MIVVRYADDTIVGFEHQDDAERFLEDLSARMGEFDLSLHPEKTRLTAIGDLLERITDDFGVVARKQARRGVRHARASVDSAVADAADRQQRRRLGCHAPPSLSSSEVTTTFSTRA
jgi:hypothetical protein